MIVEKAWGKEEILVNEKEYCAKWLHISPEKEMLSALPPRQERDIHRGFRAGQAGATRHPEHAHR